MTMLLDVIEAPPRPRIGTCPVCHGWGFVFDGYVPADFPYEPCDIAVTCPHCLADNRCPTCGVDFEIDPDGWAVVPCWNCGWVPEVRYE